MSTKGLDAAVAPEGLLAALRWRYAVKKFDPARKIPRARWEALEQALVLSPSSFGLQPWKFMVVENPVLRGKLKAASWNQSQIVDADKLVVFAARADFGAEDIARYVARVAEVRKAEPASLKPYKDMMEGALLTRTPEAREQWVARQVYLALGTFLSAAAALGVDACPMEGFDPAQYDAILGLPEKGLKAVVVATAGMRAADDGYAAAPKVRFALGDVVEYI